MNNKIQSTKITAISIFILFSFSLIAQTKTPTPEQAKEYLASQRRPIFLSYAEYRKEYGLLKNNQPGDIVIDAQRIFKIIDFKTVTAYNAGTIFLDSEKLSKEEIKILANTILLEYKQGIHFKDLIAKYSTNIDDSPEKRFIDGQMQDWFESAVRNHKAGDIFFVENPDKNLYCIVLKNEENRTVKAVEVEYGWYNNRR